MLNGRKVIFTAVFLMTPIAALADCATFSAYDANDNRPADIEARVETALSCEQWTDTFDLSGLNFSQGFVVQSLLSDQQTADAIAQARLYFEDAQQRYTRAAQDPDQSDILTPAGTLRSRMGSNLSQMGMLLADAQTVNGTCVDATALDDLLQVMDDMVRQGDTSDIARAEASRVDLEQLLEDYSLEVWQEYFPDITSKEDLRDVDQLARILEPDDDAMMAMTFRRIDTNFISLFTTSVRIEGGKAEQCLANAFRNHPQIAVMERAQQVWNFPRSSGFIARYFPDQ